MNFNSIAGKCKMIKAFHRAFIIFAIGFISSVCAVVGQEQSDSISIEIIDRAPKKLYSELYADENGNQYMVEIYEEPQDGENLIHFRAFQNGKLIGRKSQILAESHDFTFHVDERKKRLMRPDVESMLSKILKKVMDEEREVQKLTYEELRQKLLAIFDEDRMAQNISDKIKTPTAVIDEIELAKQISGQLKIPEVNIDEDKLAIKLAIKLTQKEKISAAKIPSYADLLKQVSSSNQQKNYEKTIDLLNEDLAKRTPDEQRKAMKISGLMNLLVASKKLKQALSLIADYDLPSDPELENLSLSLDKWISKNLVIQ